MRTGIPDGFELVEIGSVVTHEDGTSVSQEEWDVSCKILGSTRRARHDLRNEVKKAVALLDEEPYTRRYAYLDAARDLLREALKEKS